MLLEHSTQDAESHPARPVVPDKRNIVLIRLSGFSAVHLDKLIGDFLDGNLFALLARRTRKLAVLLRRPRLHRPLGHDFGIEDIGHNLPPGF